MRVSAYMLGFVVFLIFHASSSAQTNEPLEPIEIAIGEWKPFVTQTVDGYGEVTEIVTVVLERMGYRPKYIFMPWGQAETLVRENERDNGPRASFPFTATDKRRREFLFSAKPVFEACTNFFYNKNKISRSQDISISTIADLTQFKFGFVSEKGGFQYPQELTKVLRKSGTSFDNLFEAFNKLVDPSAEEVQVVPAILEVGEELLYELFPEQRFKIANIKEAKVEDGNQCLLPVKYYFLTSKRNPNNAELMRIFDDVHRKIDNETTARIKQKASERPSARNPEVVLIARDSPGGITARDVYGRIYYLPRGTRGLLLKWSPPSGDQGNDSSIKAEVRVISGPYRGKTLILDGKFVVLQ